MAHVSVTVMERASAASVALCAATTVVCLSCVGSYSSTLRCGLIARQARVSLLIYYSSSVTLCPVEAVSTCLQWALLLAVCCVHLCTVLATMVLHPTSHSLWIIHSCIYIYTRIPTVRTHGLMLYVVASNNWWILLSIMQWLQYEGSITLFCDFIWRTVLL